MRIRSIQPELRHAAFRADLLAVLDKHAGHLDSSEMLALASHAVGQILALQDQRTMTNDRAMEIVASNIEVGNSEVIDNLMNSKGEA